MTVEFTCAECGRPIVNVTDDVIPFAALCMSCVFHPAWFRDPDLRHAIDRDHDGLELRDRLPGDSPCP